MYRQFKSKLPVVVALATMIATAGCQGPAAKTTATADSAKKPKFLSEPIIKSIYTADPSAHVFNGKIYVYPSHDIENDILFDDLGSHFAMEDYHVFSMN